MQLKPITAIIVLLLVVASISVAGCSPPIPSPSSSPTPTPTATTPTKIPITDQSSALTQGYESGNFIMERAFTKSTNERGNDVYKGVGRNSTSPGADSVTLVVEFTKSEAQSKTVYNNEIATKKNQGYVFNSEVTAYRKSSCPECKEVWFGVYGNNRGVLCEYEYSLQFSSWVVTEQSVVAT